ncbi:MAG: branched-chain amino acid transport system / permease component family protein [Bacillales bacterium]|jgi:branched-chain amino acid transport system permease protein|nr:branched-chain amino acid transport system / permease component family protein [Bacillales bacterium]
MKLLIDKTKVLLEDRKYQTILMAVFVVITFLGLFLSQTSVIAFLLMLSSLFLLYLTKLPVKVKWFVAGLILIVLLPLAASQGDTYESFMDVATMVGIYVCMALGLNIVVGMAGLLDLGFVAFFAIGAYTYAIFATPQANNFLHFMDFPLSGNTFWLFILIGGFVAALFGVLLGIPVLRVKGDYLAIVTLGFGEIIRIVFNNMDKPINFTNGAMGISSITPPTIFGIELVNPSQFYYVILVAIVFVLFVIKKLEISKIGRSWRAVRENEIAAQAMGINLFKTKLSAFAVGALFSGMMGVIFASKQTFIDPTSFTMLESITVLVMVVLGGMGSVPGVILGAAVVTILNLQVLTEVSNWLTQLSMDGVVSIPDVLSPAKMQRFIFGLLLITFALYKPKGLIQEKNRHVDPKIFEEAGENAHASN